MKLIQLKDRASSVKGVDCESDRRVMLFDLSIRGHHPNYIQCLIQYWYKQNFSNRLDIVVSPRFIEEHSDVVSLATNDQKGIVRFLAITPEEEARLSSRKSGITRTARAFQEWQLLCQYARSLQATHCLIMYFDTFQLPLVLGFPSPCPLSGIYFRPTFHYSIFTDCRLTWRERLQQWRERFMLFRVLRHSHLETLFCLDPFAVQYLNQFHPETKAVYLPDPVKLNFSSEAQVSRLREKLGIQPGRQVFLLFGALTQRKGIQQLLTAISMLPPTVSQKLCLLLVGETRATEKALIGAQTDKICASQPVQMIHVCEFVPDQDIPAYFQLADVVLATYQRHVGMSGILLLAAAAQKPVLSSDYGLMGELVRRYELGLTVDSTIPDEIAQGTTRFLLEPPERLGDRTKMKAFAEQNSAERYASIISQYVLRDS